MRINFCRCNYLFFQLQMTDFVLLLGKLLIISILCFSWYMFFEEEMDIWVLKAPKLNFTFIPSVIIAIATYFITTQFLYVYSVAVKTIFICFCNIFTGRQFLGQFCSKCMIFFICSGRLQRQWWNFWQAILYVDESYESSWSKKCKSSRRLKKSVLRR